MYMISITLYYKENEKYAGDDLHEVLQKMWRNHFHEQSALDGMRFTVSDNGCKTSKECRFVDIYFHWCFAENDISAEELVEFCQAA